MRLWGPLRRILFSLLVVSAVAATTAGGLTTALGDIGRSVVSVGGRDVVEPAPGREVVDVTNAAKEASAASELVDPNDATNTARPSSTSRGIDGSAFGSILPDAPQAEVATPSDGDFDDIESTSLASADEAASTTTTSAVPAPTTTTTTTAAPATTSSAAPQSSAPPKTTIAPRTTTTAPVTTTTAAPVSNVVRVNNGGQANGSGFSNTPIKDALARAKPGMIFEFEPGQHQPLHISSINGAQGNHIVLTAADTRNRPVFSDNSYTERAGIEVSGSSNVTLSYLDVRKSMWGVRVEASSGVVVEAVRVTDIGQEGIRVAQRSSYVTIRNSVVSGTGRRTGTASDGQSYSLFGEGIYVGTGKDASDEVHHIVIAGNDISQTGTEAIDIKAPVNNVEITQNVIHDIQTGTSGAIVIHVSDGYSAASPNIKITNNTISNISTDSQYRDGVGIVLGSSADVIGNTIRNTAHYGIRIEDSGSQGNRITANIRDNSFSSTGQDAIWQSGNSATVNSSGNSGA